MKRSIPFVLALAMTSLLTSRALAIVAYVDLTLQPGANWIENPLNSGTGDPLSAVFSDLTVLNGPPNGTTVSLWDPATGQFATTSTFNNGVWSDDFVLDPGTGALLNTPSQFVSTITGTVENFDGSILSGDADLTEPPAFSGPPGTYFLGSKAPTTLSGDVFAPPNYSVFLAIIGRAPNNGDQVTTLDALTQTKTTTTFVNGAWNNGDPTLPIGDAAMIYLAPTPEPSPLAILAAGFGLAGAIFTMRARIGSSLPPGR